MPIPRFGGGIGFSGDIAGAIFACTLEKARKLRDAKREIAQMFLVIQLFDTPLSEMHRGLEQIDAVDFAEFGFEEIWVAAHSTIDAYDRVELFGVYPEAIAGYYALTAGCKPYG